MKLIIDIPDEMAHRFKNEGEQKHYDYHTVLKACVDATPLEKHDEELLDKIRAEIEELRNFRIFRDDVLDIIDKYGKGQIDEINN